MIHLLEQFNARFQHSLLGKWATAEGTFNLLYDVFEFEATGKGTWLSGSGSNEYLVHFEWRSKAPFTIQIREEEEENWLEIVYEFKLVDNDLQPTVILCQPGMETFYLAMTKIAYVENVERTI
jgi:hypothetical protein